MSARYLSRKFLLTVGVLASAVTFFALDKMTAPEFIGFAQFTLASYLALNVGQKYVEKAKAA